jgi:CheY-like chemotaxis protein
LSIFSDFVKKPVHFRARFSIATFEAPACLNEEVVMHGPILIVDDDDVTRHTLTVLLNGAGYNVVPAADGQEALNYLSSHPAPALVLLDLRMPVADGWQFLAERARDPVLASVPVVVLSAARSVRAAAMTLGATDFYEKPIDPDDLLAVVGRYA